MHRSWNETEDQMEVDELLEAFESRWDDGEMPDVVSFADRCASEDLASVASELIQIDMERRWRTGHAGKPIELSEYLEVLPNVFSSDELLELICSEYRIRNLWGDCISREKVRLKYGDPGENLFARLDSVAEEIPWPLVSIVVSGQTIFGTPLDRDITAGRQSNPTQKPWSVLTNDLTRHIVLCESMDASLSRNQLAISRSAPESVLLRNISTNRAIAVRGCDPIDSGGTLICKLPVFIHLGSTRYLRICSSEEPSD